MHAAIFGCVAFLFIAFSLNFPVGDECAPSRTQGAAGSKGDGACGVVPEWSRGQCDSLGVGLRVQEGEAIYDYCWFPQMTATDAASCCFASSSRVCGRELG